MEYIERLLEHKKLIKNSWNKKDIKNGKKSFEHLFVFIKCDILYSVARKERDLDAIFISSLQKKVPPGLNLLPQDQ